MDPVIILLLILGLTSTLAYFRGRKKNRWISGWISAETEEVLQPRDTKYVNIGGQIGYNSTLTLDPPFTEAKGTFTLLPRQSLLYLPISLLTRRHDRYFLTLYTGSKLFGEGHIIARRYFAAAARQITGMDTLKRADVEAHGEQFVLLWDVRIMEEKLRSMLEALEASGTLLHFCCYKPNGSFFFQLNPKKEHLKTFLSSAYPALRQFIPGAERVPKKD